MAEIFARDRAICGFTGLNLWLLDEGACGSYNVNWIDHITPSARGGLSTEDNGITTHWAYNYNKSDNTGANLYLFQGGFPTETFWAYHRTISIEMARRVARFAELHPSDWYFNRAIENVMWGAGWLHYGKAAGRTRDDEYYSRAALRRLQGWRQLVATEEVTSLEDRNLVLEPLVRDRKLLLSLREMTTTKQIKKLMRDILPYHAANCEAIDSFQEAYLSWLDGDDEAFEIVFDKLENPFVSAVVLENTVSNIRLLVDPHRDWIAEDVAFKEQERK